MYNPFLGKTGLKDSVSTPGLFFFVSRARLTRPNCSVAPPPALAPDSIEPIPPANTSAYEGFRRYGFRVPNVVISPWSKKNHVSHMVYDHTSILATIQRKWNLPAMTMRDANANDLLDYIDLDALKKGRMNFPDINSLKLAAPGNTTQQLACSITGGAGVIPPVGSLVNVTGTDAPVSHIVSKPGFLRRPR